jgi:N-acetylneuraminic acid mutarotase
MPDKILHKYGLAAAIFMLLTVLACAEQAGGSWSEGAAMPTARSELAVTQLGERIYVAGGIGRWGTTGAFEAYYPSSNSWAALAPLPEQAHHLAMAAADGRIYVSGGYADLRFSPDRKSTWSYDPKVNQWRRVADMPGPRAAHKLVALGGKLYAVGGVGPESTALWVYDPTSDQWDTLQAPLPTAREHLASVAVGGKIYVIGGRWKGRGNLAVVETYDPLTGSWSRMADLPAPRGGHTAANLKGLIHVTGGEDLSSGNTFADHWVYDPATDRWNSNLAMPTARHGLDSAAADERWYVVGGGTGAGARTFLTLTSLIEVYIHRKQK